MSEELTPAQVANAVLDAIAAYPHAIEGPDPADAAADHAVANLAPGDRCNDGAGRAQAFRLGDDLYLVRVERVPAPRPGCPHPRRRALATVPGYEQCVACGGVLPADGEPGDLACDHLWRPDPYFLDVRRCVRCGASRRLGGGQ